MNKKVRLWDWVFCSILFLLPFLHVNIGLNIADQGYNLANFEAFPDMNRMWMIATLVANLVGKFFTFLPGGHYMLGMNVYCTLLLSVISVVIYNVLKKDYSRYAVFAGLVIAICFSWAPKVTLYQYLSYYLFCGAALLVVRGIVKQKRSLLYVAGIVLGISLFVRFPNILQTALIVPVIGGMFIYRKKVVELLKDIGVCVLGYLTIVIPVIVVLEIIYGSGAYMSMIQSLFAMTESATSYTPLSMVYSMYASYFENIKWFVWFLIEAVLATILYGFLRKKWEKIMMYLIMATGFLFILRVYWYWGVMNIKYTQYQSVYLWGVLFLMLGILVLTGVVFIPRYPKEKKVYALAGLVIIFITPLGSNNALYSNFNNLYLLAPLVIGSITDLLLLGRNAMKKETVKIWRFSAVPMVLISYMLVAVLFFQTFMFHLFFVFGDPVFAGNSLAVVKDNSVLSGIVTTADTAEDFEGLTAFLEQESYAEQECIVWSHSPMVYYAMKLECAIGHTWPTLDSYPYDEFVTDIQAMEEYPLVIYEVQYYPDLLENAEGMDSKTLVLQEVLRKGEYKEVYRNNFYAVCVPGASK